MLEQIYLGWMLLINLVTAIMYAKDKLAARAGHPRIPERMLWTLNVIGGVLGAWFIFFWMRHKTQHSSFWVVQSICTILHFLLALKIFQLAF